jgi:hypothetical protein
MPELRICRQRQLLLLLLLLLLLQLLHLSRQVALQAAKQWQTSR